MEADSRSRFLEMTSAPREICIATVAVNTTPLDFSGNEALVREGLRRAREGGAELVVFPELVLSGYGAEDAFLWRETRERALRSLSSLAKETNGIAAVVGAPVEFEGAVYSAAVVLHDGRVVAIVPKQNLARQGIHYEPRWFEAWKAGVARKFELDGASIPFGDVLVRLGKHVLGVEICEDAWVRERPAKRLVERGATLIVNPSASHFAFAKDAERARLVVEGSNFGVVYAYANLLGNEAGRVIYDGDCLVATGGRLVARSVGFSFEPLTVTLARVAPEEPRLTPPLPRPLRTKEEEFARAATLGLFDYLRKSGSAGFVLSLSGGADSATIAVLVLLLVRFGVSELGFERFRERLGPFAESLQSEEDLRARLLRTAYQATSQSGEITRAAARAVARLVGSTHHEFSIEELVGHYTRLAESALGRSLEWSTDDVPLQNVQARVRSPSVWLLANVTGALLLATSNRSESAVGYATMDGDTSGGLSPLSGIDKAFLRRFLVFLEERGFPESGPLLELRLVNEQAPTAELRPPSAAQTDEKDLMPYEILDRIERLLVFERLPVLEIERRLALEFGPASGGDGRSVAELRLFLGRFLRLFSRNQWKRERYAPSFHYDDENLDPRSWLRFPILSGGFEAALRELEALASDPGTPVDASLGRP